MNSVVRVVAGSAAVCLSLAFAGCAPKFAPSLIRPESKAAFPQDTSFELVADKDGGCVKANGPFVILGSSGGMVRWTITNKCGKDATVTLDKFKLKHKIWGSGPHPFLKDPASVLVKNGEAQEIPAKVRESASVGSNVKGVNVYRYRVRIKTTDGRQNDDDPELIIDWP